MNLPLNKSTYQAAPTPAVLERVKKDTTRMLARRLQNLFQNADNALFEKADRAATDAEKNIYFDSMRIIRLRRADIQQNYLHAYTRSWSAMLSGTPVAATNNLQPTVTERLSTLSHNDIEIVVAAADISTKVTTRYLLPLTKLTKRLETVCAREIEPELNPLSPQSLNQNFVSAITPLEVDIKVRVIFLQLFERFVAEDLADVYDWANEVLSDAGNLTARAVSDVLPDNKELSSAESNRSEPRESESQVSTLLISTPELMQSLGHIRSSTSDTSLTPERKPETQLETQLETRNEDVVDLVQLLFEFMLNDDNLAVPMKELIGRLQMPVLKVALMDQSLFAMPTHPARQLLNELADAGIGWSSTGELRQDETYAKIDSIVGRVANEFSEELSLFTELIAELRDFLDKQSQQRDQVEQRVRQTEARKAKTRKAKDAVRSLINRKSSGLYLPADAGRFVSKAWGSVLVYLFVTQGPDSEKWFEAIESLDELLWALQPLTTERDVRKREEMLPHLLTQLEAGITLVNHNDARGHLKRLRIVIENLHTLDQQGIDGETPTSFIDNGRVASKGQPASELVPKENPLPGQSLTLAHPQFVKSIMQFSEGQWLELRDDSAALVRCKLAVIDQPGDRYVFVNSKGMKVCERSGNALALALQTDQLQVIDGTDTFDRALESVVAELQVMNNAKRGIR